MRWPRLAIGEGSAGNTNASALSDLSSANVVGSQTASGFLASFLGQIGSDTFCCHGEQWGTTGYTHATDDPERFAVRCSLDEEAAHLTQYQRAYQAAAQVFNIANSIMASALNLGVQTSVT